MTRAKKDGTSFKHLCIEPEEFKNPAPEKGPWFGAMYDGWCSGCEDAIHEGDQIRADGQGGYECEDCDENWKDAGDDDNGFIAPTADEFMDPAPVALLMTAK